MPGGVLMLFASKKIKFLYWEQAFLEVFSGFLVLIKGLLMQNCLCIPDSHPNNKKYAQKLL